MEETRICKVCGRELKVEEFSKNRGGYTYVCQECSNKKKRETWAKRKETKNLERELELKDAKTMRLSDFTPRELFAELKRRGYEFKATYTETHTIDSKDF